MIFDSYLTSGRQENEIITSNMHYIHAIKRIQSPRLEIFLPKLHLACLNEVCAGSLRVELFDPTKSKS